MDRRPLQPYLVPAPPPDLPERHRRGAYRSRMDDVLDRAEQVRGELAAVRETVSSPDGAVVATVDGSGALTGLRFGPRAYGLAPERLAELVLAAAADAAAAATRRAVGLLERVEESRTGDQQFGPVRGEIPPRTGPGRRSWS